MKNNRLVVVGAVFLVLLVGWFATRDSQPKVGVKELKVQQIAADSVTKVEITIPGKAAKKLDAPPEALDKQEQALPSVVVLEKDGASFSVSGADGKKKPVDDAQLKPLLDAISEFATGDLVSNKAEKLQDFEIDDEQGAHLVITTTKGKALDLMFGRAAKGGGTTVRQQGKNEVFVAKGRLGGLLKKDAAQWRKKTMIDKKAEDFSSITIARADASKIVLTAESKEEPLPAPVEGAEPKAPLVPKVTTTWKLAEPSLPAGYRLDEPSLPRLASSLAALRAADFVDDVKNGSGFDVAHTVITAKLKDGKELVVHLGARDDKKRVFARVDGDPQVYLLAEFTAKNVDKGLDDFRDLTLFSAKVDDVSSVTFTSGKTKVIIDKVGGEWTLIEPKTAPPEFDVTQIGAVVSGVLRNKGARLAVGIVDNGNDPSIEVKLTSGKTEALRFGKPVPLEDAGTAKPDDKPREYYATAADGHVYIVNAFARARYEKPTELFKKPAVAPPALGAGGMSGLDSLPPDVRKKLEASLKNKGLKSPD